MHHFTSSNLNDTESYYLHSAKSKTCLDDDTMFHFCLWVQVSISVSVKVLFSDSTFKLSLNYESTHQWLRYSSCKPPPFYAFSLLISIRNTISKLRHIYWYHKSLIRLSLQNCQWWWHSRENFLRDKILSGSYLSIYSSCCAPHAVTFHFLDLSLIAGHCI